MIERNNTMGPNTRPLLPLTEALESPVWALPYGTGPLAPLYASGGFSVGDDDDDDEDDDQDEDDDDRRPVNRPRPGPRRGRQDDDRDDDQDDDQDDDEGRQVKLSAKDLKALKLAQRGASKQANAYKRMLRDAGIDPRTGKARRDDRDDYDDRDDDYDRPRRRTRDRDDRDDRARGRVDRDAVRRAEERAEARAEARAEERVLLVASEVPEALEKAGFTGTPSQWKRALKVVNLDGVEDSEDLLLAVTDLKDDFPEWFRAKRTRRSTNGNGQGGARRGTLRTQDRRGNVPDNRGKSDPLSWARKMGVEAGVISNRDDD